MRPSDLLAEGIGQLAVPHPEQVKSLLSGFLAELDRWNPTYGFVKASAEDLVIRHVLDSLSAWKTIDELARQGPMEAEGVLDVGSGSGFPGIPLAAALPGIRFTLLERSARKASFLKTCAILLGLRNVAVREAALSQVTGGFAVLTFRAVAPLDRLLREASRAALRFDWLAAYKGRMDRTREEIASVPGAVAEGFEFSVRPLAVPHLDAERCLLIARAKRPAPSGGA